MHLSKAEKNMVMVKFVNTRVKSQFRLLQRVSIIIGHQKQTTMQNHLMVEKRLTMEQVDLQFESQVSTDLSPNSFRIYRVDLLIIFR